MSNIIRVCNPFEMTQVLEFDGSVAKGLVSEYINQLIELLHRSENVTVVVRSQGDGVGELVNKTTGTFSGCIGLLQTNESDLMMREVTYPLEVDNVEQGGIFGDSVIQFFTLYSASKEEEAAQVSSSFALFDTSVWCLSFLTFLVAYLLMLARYRMKSWWRKEITGKKSASNRKKNVAYQVATHMTRYGEIGSSSGTFNKILYLVLSIFSFLVIFYFGSIIKTELVVVKPPEVIKSYQDLTDRKMGLVFLFAADTYLYFKLAPQNSIERKLWDFSIARYSEHGVVSNTDLASLVKMAKLVMNRRMAFVSDSLWASLLLQQICPGTLDQKQLDLFHQIAPDIPPIKAGSFFPYLGQDPKARVFTKGYLISNRKTDALKKVRRGIRLIWEVGMVDKLISEVNHVKLAEAFLGVKSKGVRVTEEMQKCLKNILIMAEHALQPLAWQNITHVVWLMGYLYLALTVLLLAEAYLRATVE